MALRELRNKYGIRLRKSLGQNVLIDDNINRIMVEAAELTPDQDVLEVGAGLGALTRRLCREAGRVLAVEIDESFMPILEEQLGRATNVRLFRGDILNHRLDELLGEYLPGGAQHKMVSNLPYYITTPILFHFWESPVWFSAMVVMVQEEVGLRLTAEVGAHNYGVLSLAARLYSEVDMIRRVPRTCFAPRPNVDSCIVRLRNRRAPLYPDVDAGRVMQVIRSAFRQRRKTLKNSLARSGSLGVPPSVVIKAMEVAGIDAGRRPQSLTLEEFVRLSREIRALGCTP